MRFGLWYDFRNPPDSGRSNQQLYRETLDEIVYGEKLGFEDIWLSEHHFIADGYLPKLSTRGRVEDVDRAFATSRFPPGGTLLGPSGSHIDASRWLVAAVGYP